MSGRPTSDADPRARLAGERARTGSRLAVLRGDFDGVVEASRDSNADDEHDPEGQTIAYERSQLATLIRQTEHHLRDIDAALQRIEDGTYGICVVCGGPIAAARLEVRPMALTCVACA
jgi:RNA polymerase-binding transcription factor DksA